MDSNDLIYNRFNLEPLTKYFKDSNVSIVSAEIMLRNATAVVVWPKMVREKMTANRFFQIVIKFFIKMF